MASPKARARRKVGLSLPGKKAAAVGIPTMETLRIVSTGRGNLIRRQASGDMCTGMPSLRAKCRARCLFFSHKSLGDAAAAADNSKSTEFRDFKNMKLYVLVVALFNDHNKPFECFFTAL